MSYYKVDFSPSAKAYLMGLKLSGNLADAKTIYNFLKALPYTTSKHVYRFKLVLKNPDIFQAEIAGWELTGIKAPLLITACLEEERILIQRIDELSDVFE